MSKIDKATDQLYKAVQKYIEAKGGRVLVIGGIEILHCPEDLKMNFKLAVRCTGRKPEYSAEDRKS